MPAVPRQAIRKESCWTISNITAGNREQIQEAMKSTMNMASFSTEPFLTINDLMMCISFGFSDTNFCVYCMSNQYIF
jgi:hypothetical protein